MTQRDKQQWIDQVMHSLDDLPPAAPARDLYSRIEAAINNTGKTRIIPLKTVSAAAAALLLLLAANYLSLFGKKPEAKTDTIEEVARYYQLNNDGQYGL